MNKKGLSSVVTTVLIILLVLAAVVIIWSFLRPTLDRVGSVESASCLTIDLEPLSCSTSTDSAEVRRNSGGGDLVGMKVIIEGEVSDWEEVLEVHQTGVYTLPEEISPGASFNVAAVVGEQMIVCDPKYEAITCE